MNTERIQAEIDKIIKTTTTKGWKLTKTTKKALAEAEALGLTPYLGIYARADVKGAQVVEAVIAAAKDAGGKTIRHSHMGEDGDYVSWTTEPSALWLALNETEPEPEGNDSINGDEGAQAPSPADEARQADDFAELYAQWLAQEPPSRDELTEQDVFAAYTARNIELMRREGAWDWQHQVEVEAARDGFDEYMSLLKRGLAILNGYRYAYTPRWQVGVPIDPPDGAIVWRDQPAGYAGHPMHRVAGLVPIGELITISRAARILYGDSSQTAIMRVSRLIESGRLTEYRDYGTRNPQHSRRVGLDEVMRIAEHKDGDYEL